MSNGDDKLTDAEFRFIEQANDEYWSMQKIAYCIPRDLSEKKIKDWIRKIRSWNRQSLYSLQTQQQKPFEYWQTPRIQKQLHLIDVQRFEAVKIIQDPKIFKKLLFSSLIDEAYYSARLEGSVTARERAEEMIRQELSPQDKSEFMVKNNFRAMQYILHSKEGLFSVQWLLELHKIVTENTLDDEIRDKAGRYREGPVFITHPRTHNPVYTPPEAGKVPGMVESLLSWLGRTQDEKNFVHPVVCACVAHFYLAYIHPFADGNGRTARALMYAVLLWHGYDFAGMFSFSKQIASDRKKYDQALIDSESAENDLTHFVLFNVQVIFEAIQSVQVDALAVRLTALWMSKLDDIQYALNERQKKTLKSMFGFSMKEISIEAYRRQHKVVYQTAREDLRQLEAKGMVIGKKIGRKFSYNLNTDFFLGTTGNTK